MLLQTIIGACAGLYVKHFVTKDNGELMVILLSVSLCLNIHTHGVGVVGNGACIYTSHMSCECIGNEEYWGSCREDLATSCV